MIKPYKLIRHRLQRLFQIHAVETEKDTFASFDAYVLAHAPTPPQECAKRRMREIWAGWVKCVNRQPELRSTMYPQHVGYILDAHIAVALNRTANLGINTIYRENMAPEQTTISVSPESAFTKHVRQVWQNNTLSHAFIKLLTKGKPLPKSVRYIRPQLLRCGDTAESRELASQLLRNWALGSYAHRQQVMSPSDRMDLWQLDFNGLVARVEVLSSRSLYYVVAECICAATLYNAPLHIYAAGMVRHFAEYATIVLDAASTIAQTPSTRIRVTVPNHRPAGSPAAELPSVPTIQQWPCPPHVTALQMSATKKSLGFHTLYRFACTLCQTLHIPLDKQPRAAKAKIGVSIEIGNPAAAVCNNCGNDAQRVQLTGNITSVAHMGNRRTLAVCVACGVYAFDFKLIGDCPHCADCFHGAQRVTLATAQPCPCGDVPYAFTQNKKYFIAETEENKAQTYFVCDDHSHLVANVRKVHPASEWARVFTCTT